MNQDSPKDIPTPTGARTFKLPSREELEERRRLLEESSSKPPLLFKPTGIVSHTPNVSNRTGNATNFLHTSTTAQGSMATVSTTTTELSFMSSRQHLLQQQQQQQQGAADMPGRNAPASVSDDEFGFGDLDEAILDDDLFDIDDAVSSNSPSVAASSIASVAATVNIATAALVAPPTFVPKSKSTIVVKSTQRGNPLLQFIRNVPYEFGDIVPDYVVGLTSCVMFLR